MILQILPRIVKRAVADRVDRGGIAQNDFAAPELIPVMYKINVHSNACLGRITVQSLRKSLAQLHHLEAANVRLPHHSIIDIPLLAFRHISGRGFNIIGKKAGIAYIVPQIFRVKNRVQSTKPCQLFFSRIIQVLLYQTIQRQCERWRWCGAGGAGGVSSVELAAGVILD